MKQGLFDTAAASSRERETASDRERRVAAERVYNAGVMARSYVGTTAEAWLAYFEGKGERPVAWGTPHTRQQAAKTARVYAGVFIPANDHAITGSARVIESVVWVEERAA